MAIVAGVDFGTLSVRVSIVDSEKGALESAVAEYPLHRKREDPEFATQSHEDHMRALALATREALNKAGVYGKDVKAIALHTTGSSVVPVDAKMAPLDEYYLWCDHRAKAEAAEITELANREGLEAIRWCGGVYSSEWGFAKLLHWLRHNPDKRAKFASAFEHCDMVAATLCGVTDPSKAKRSICAMGHKWLWHADRGGLPSEEFLVKLDPLLAGVRAKLAGQYETSDKIAGALSPYWAEKLGLRAGIPIPVGAFDAHWDAIGAGTQEKDVANVVGTSTCIIGISSQTQLVPGVCGVVTGSVHPGYTGIEAGLSATGDIFEAIARRGETPLLPFSGGIGKIPSGPDRIVTHDLGQWRPHGAGESESARNYFGLEFAEHGAGRTFRGDRRDGVSHAGDSGSHGGTWHEDRARDQCRRNSAEQSSFESGVRQRAGASGAGAEQESDQPGFGNFRVSGGGNFQDDRRSAEADLSFAHRVSSAEGSAGDLRRTVRAVPETLF